jgi:hypothetical protein
MLGSVGGPKGYGRGIVIVLVAGQMPCSCPWLVFSVYAAPRPSLWTFSRYEGPVPSQRNKYRQHSEGCKRQCQDHVKLPG